MNVDTSGLPVEMQQRIADIIQKAKANVPAPAESPHQAAIPPVVRQPSLMDHTVALRQEVAALSQQLAAMGQVVEAVGQAVGQMYGMFHDQTTLTDPGATYSSQFQQQVTEDDY